MRLFRAHQRMRFSCRRVRNDGVACTARDHPPVSGLLDISLSSPPHHHRRASRSIRDDYEIEMCRDK